MWTDDPDRNDEISDDIRAAMIAIGLVLVGLALIAWWPWL